MEMDDLVQAVIAGKDADVVTLVKEALEKNVPVKEILDTGLIPGMTVIGDRFQKHEIFLPEMLIAARAMKAGMEVLKPHLTDAKDTFKGKVVIGTVQGDLHDIGKNLVGFMLEGSGFEVVDVGVDVAPEAFYQSVVDNKADALGLSALLTTTMVNMKQVIQHFVDNAYRDNIKIMIGGAPLTQEFADDIGADGYAQDAPAAVGLCKTLLGVS